MARGDDKYARRLAATQKAAADRQKEIEEMHRKHEGSGHAPAKLSKREMRLIDEEDKKPKRGIRRRG